MVVVVVVVVVGSVGGSLGLYPSGTELGGGGAGRRRFGGLGLILGGLSVDDMKNDAND